MSFKIYKDIGFYPIVDSAKWIEILAPLGVKTIQLRIKNLFGQELESEIKKSIEIANHYNCNIFINDYWRDAIKYHAFGVHLGQEDLLNADIKAIKKSGLHLGISTHCLDEFEIALALNPSYIAIGPIFPTTLKKMNFPPQGIEGFRKWRKVTDLPLVAIGGLTIENSKELLEAGADSIAVVSDITKNPDPVDRTKKWLEIFKFNKKDNIDFI